MMRIIATISILTTLAGCSSGVTFHTNIDNDVLSQKVGEHVARGDLQQFYSDQEAHESGATLLGRVEGQICMSHDRNVEGTISDNRAKSNAIHELKNNVINRGANAFTINSCSKTATSYCHEAMLCSGQAYNY
ncbi:hypothetical protein PESP_a3071 [Pseudoalteromonas espejiana DSM 9414]|uniref:Lipoprotein n=1 Tax=Pseudoalteromonas espejiana TaxID=28107 RepID=A0A510XSR4_9GAMM|nr:hypothetical protein [Pseudoalteromonas espejiana]ASM50940.1 hypothetical protein PESP_a3071 [Pseudoalteromonas espejiana DSM 9414]GEK54074.1 hypothetical protein PES01_09190 [Pseudoalteromonas espejiana]